MLRMIPAGMEREQHLDLLLLADESEAQVRSYMHQGDLFVWELDGVAAGIVLAIPDDDGEVELKAVAVTPERQGQGTGSAMLRAVLAALRGRGVRRVTVGTGNSGIGQLAFYQKVGFRLSHIERDYFSPARGYPEQFEENGIPLRDMVWMDQEL